MAATSCTIRHTSVAESLRMEEEKKLHDDRNVPVYRNLASSSSANQRFSLVSTSQYIPDNFALSGSSISLKDDTQSFNSYFLQRCSSENNFGRKSSSHSEAETKRTSNQSLKTFLQKKISPASRRPKPAKFSLGKDDGLPPIGPNVHQSQFDLPFFMPTIESADHIDLSTCGSKFAGATVRPLHYSILGRDHCFEVVTSSGTRCFACASAGERQSWIEKIKRAIQPNLDNIRRTEHQLILFVQEAKGLTSKKKYFCEICLDRKLCARTTSKWKNESGIFWAEHFEFFPLPGVQDVTIHLYKDSDKKKKKDKDYIGLVNLSISSLVNQQSVEKWYTLSTPSGNNKNKAGETMALRIKARFNSTQVLPIDMYKRFAEYISVNYLKICSALSNTISVTRKDEIARILVSIMHGTGCITKFMTEIVMTEVEKVEEESLIFRENTIGTKSVEAVLRLVGMKYLNDIFGDFIHALFNMQEECEVDGSRLPPHASLEINQRNLLMSCEIALCKIVTSVNIFPGEMREIMSTWRLRCEAAGRPRIASRLVTASLFLRLLCPAIFNPSLFELAREVPDARVSRTLTLIAKVIQNLANRTRFGNKEEYMQFMDVFVREKWDEMGTFINNVSDPAISPHPKGFHGYIDLGKEFAKLHTFFVEILKTLNKETMENLGELPLLLDEITELLDKPNHSSFPSSSASKHASVSSEHTQQPVSSTSFQSNLDLHHFSNNTCSHNNNNNSYASYTTAAFKEPISKSTSTQALDSSPLMFTNPAYKLTNQKQHGSVSSLSQWHNSLNLQHNSMLHNYNFKKNPQDFSVPTSSTSNLYQSTAQTPHLETTFAAQTVTSHLDPSSSQLISSNNANDSQPELSSSESAPSSVEGGSSSRFKYPKSDQLARLHESFSINGTNPGGNEYHFVSPEGTTQFVANANLRTGLQSCSKGNTSQSKPSVSHPQNPMSMPQTTFGALSTARHQESGRAQKKLSLDNKEEFAFNYPKFELTNLAENVVLTLNSNDGQQKSQSSLQGGSSKYADVALPATAVKSRVVMLTSNANRVKTSQHTSNKSKSQQNNQVSQSKSQFKASNYVAVQPNPSSSLPPDGAEGLISPEARTAQWILSNTLPALENEAKNDDIKAVLFSKDYEDRILRLEGEVERLRRQLKNESDSCKTARQNEAFLADKIHAYEKRESKLRKHAKDKENHIRTLSHRLSVLQSDILREKDDSTLLQKQVQNKDNLLREQQALVASLQRKLQVFEQQSPSSVDFHRSNGDFSFRDDLASGKS